MKRMITGRSGAWILVLCMAVLIGCSQRADGAGTAGTPVETGTAGAAGETDTPGAAEEAGTPGTTGIQGNEDTLPPMEETVNRFEILDVKESSTILLFSFYQRPDKAGLFSFLTITNSVRFVQTLPQMRSGHPSAFS